MIKIEPQIVLISSDFDFTTDLVAAELADQEIPFCRINLEDLLRDRISLSLPDGVLKIESAEANYLIIPSQVSGVYFRGPCWVRSHTKADIEPLRITSRLQGWAFLRSILWDVPKKNWLDHPDNVYHAEHKILQLTLASRCGFSIPDTVVTNHSDRLDIQLGSAPYAAKGLETILFETPDGGEGFMYTEPLSHKAAKSMSLDGIPLQFQNFIEPKLDIRVTVVGEKHYAASIMVDDQPVSGDWRKHKDNVRYENFSLPESVRNSIKTLMSELGLGYGAIDLALKGDEFYFLEVNPTGEWAWLSEALSWPIAKDIVSRLT